jgi:hypothetical protein
MLRFFRKYQKIILAVGGTILLIIFLVPQAVTGMSGLSARRGRTLATYSTLSGEAEKMTAGELEEAQYDLRVLREGLKLPSAAGELRALVDVMLGVQIERPEHWFLLVAEAEDLGLIGGWDDAEILATALGTLLAEQGQPAPPVELVLEFMARNSGVNSIEAVQGALTRLQGVRRLINLAAPGQVSPPRLAEVADEVLQGMDAQVAVIVPRIESEEEESEEAAEEEGEEQAHPEPAEATEDAPADEEAEPPPFTDEELQAQFARYAEFAPGEGERGFGYRHPDRVRLEWISITAASVREALERTDKVSSLELRNYWRRNRDRFTLPGADPGAETRFEDVENQVREALLEELTADALAQIERFVSAELSRSTRELTRDGIHYALPEDWSDRRVKLHILAERLQQYARDEMNLPLALPAYERPDEWYSASDAALIPGIGRAFSTEYSREQRYSLRDLIPALKELDGSETIPVQAGVAFGPLRQADGSLYFARVLEAEKSHPPAALDDVRDDVIADLKRLREYDRLAAQVEAIERVAVEQGMQALSEEYDTFAMPVRDINLVPEESLFASYGRAPTTIPMLGRDDETVKAIMDYGRQVIRAMLADGRTIEDLTTEDLTFVLPVPGKLAIVAVQFTNLRAASHEEVAAYIMHLQDLIARDEIGEDHVEDLFSWDAMSARYVFARAGGEELDDDAAQDAGENAGSAERAGDSTDDAADAEAGASGS